MRPGPAAWPPELALSFAAAHATGGVPIARPDERVGPLRARIAGHRFDSAADVAVVDEGALVGLVSIERLLAADTETEVGDLVDPDPPVVMPETDEEHAARAMVEKRGASAAVVDDQGRFRGLIPPARMLAVVSAAHEEDLARLGGYLAGATRARGAVEEPVLRRLWHRLPWLVLGLVGAMASALIVAGFEDQLDANVMLAFFIPAIVYMADAVGTQTETLLIRALSVGVTVRSILGRELLSGLIMGALIGAAFLVFALVGWGEPDVAIAVALALFASCSVATGVAMALPALFQRIGKDPAFGSGPLATVAQDLISIVVYFAVVAAVVS